MSKGAIEYIVETGMARVRVGDHVVVFGAIEHPSKAEIMESSDYERTGPGEYAFRGSSPYPGLVRMGRISSSTRRRCGVCNKFVRGSSMRRHAVGHVRRNEA